MILKILGLEVEEKKYQSKNDHKTRSALEGILVLIFLDFGGFWEASWEGNRAKRHQKWHRKTMKNEGQQDGQKSQQDVPTSSESSGPGPSGRSPPKGRVNPYPPPAESPLPHFSTPFPSNPFPSSSFPSFPSLPLSPLSWPVLACLGSTFPPNLAPTWLPKSTQIQTKWSLDGVPILTSFLHRFLFDFYSELGPPKLQKSLKIHLLYNRFLFFTLFKIRSIFNPILVPTWLHFPSQNPSKSLQKPILKGIDFLIDFDIDFKTAQEGPKTAQDKGSEGKGRERKRKGRDWKGKVWKSVE